MKRDIEEKSPTYVSVVMNAESAEKSYSIENFVNLVKEKFGIPSFGFEKEMSISDAFDEILDKQSVSDWFLTEFGVEVRIHYNVSGYIMYGNTTSDGRHYVTYETFAHLGRTRTLEGLKM